MKTTDLRRAQHLVDQRREFKQQLEKLNRLKEKLKGDDDWLFLSGDANDVARAFLPYVPTQELIEFIRPYIEREIIAAEEVLKQYGLEIVEEKRHGLGIGS